MGDPKECAKCGRPQAEIEPGNLCVECRNETDPVAWGIRRIDESSVPGERDSATGFDTYATRSEFDPASTELSGQLGSGTHVRYFGDYEILEEIARGGMGVVYRARQLSLNRVVALKMILSSRLADQAEVARFHAEAEAAANLDHPQIVPIYEVGQFDDQHYFSMKLIGGGNLCGRMKELAKNHKAAAGLVATIARAVHAAHLSGILHRDLKPANILIDTQGQPHVSDFGLAKRLDGGSGLTRSGAVMGTPSYMAPEQAEGLVKTLTPAADIYAIGAILYEILTGNPPFRGESTLAILKQVVEKEPVRPSTLVPGIGRDLETICLKCLEKDPRRRYHSAEDLAADLDRWSRGEPIIGRSTSWLERAIKWTRREPTTAFLSLAVFVLFAGLMGTAWKGRGELPKVETATSPVNLAQPTNPDSDPAAPIEVQISQDLEDVRDRYPASVAKTVTDQFLDHPRVGYLHYNGRLDYVLTFRNTTKQPIDAVIEQSWKIGGAPPGRPGRPIQITLMPDKPYRLIGKLKANEVPIEGGTYLVIKVSDKMKQPLNAKPETFQFKQLKLEEYIDILPRYEHSNVNGVGKDYFGITVSRRKEDPVTLPIMNHDVTFSIDNQLPGPIASGDNDLGRDRDTHELYFLSSITPNIKSIKWRVVIEGGVRTGEFPIP